MRKDARTTWLLRVSIPALFAFVLASPCEAARCEDLLNLKLPDTVVKSAEPVTRPDLPAYCRVVASVKGSPDSDIAVEIWLPDKWTGVFHGNGNGGFGGSIGPGYGGVGGGLRPGY